MQPSYITVEAAKRTPRPERIHGDVSKAMLVRERRRRDRAAVRRETRLLTAVRALRPRHAG